MTDNKKSFFSQRTFWLIVVLALQLAFNWYSAPVMWQYATLKNQIAGYKAVAAKMQATDAPPAMPAPANPPSIKTSLELPFSSLCGTDNTEAALICSTFSRGAGE
jgi:hypothetical protein